jgi:hypothetical protein
MKTRPIFPPALALLLAATLAYGGETGTMRQATELMAAPYRDANVADKLAQKARVEILERRGAWLRVTANGRSGWVRLHQVSVGEGPQSAKSGEGLKMLWNVKETGRSGSSGIVATTGIRGMSAEELKSAKPDPEGVKQLERYAASEETARKQAASAGLKDQNVSYLAKPQE